MPAPVSITAPNSPKKRGGKTSYGGSRPSPSGGHAAPARTTPTVTTVSPSGAVVSSGPSSAAATARARASQARVRRIQHAVAMTHKRPAKPITAKLPSPTSKPKTFLGKRTVGTPTLISLQKSLKKGNLMLTANQKAWTTPQVRQVSKQLKEIKGRAPSLQGLSPDEKTVVPLVEKASKKYGIPASVMMAQIRQESGFDPNALSSAGAFGLSQFIPSTAASYGVKPGDTRAAMRSQVMGQAHLLSDEGFNQDPKAALSSYTGGYSDAQYNDPVPQGAADYKALDHAGKLRPQDKRVLVQARKLGLDGRPTDNPKDFKPATAAQFEKKYKGKFVTLKDQPGAQIAASIAPLADVFTRKFDMSITQGYGGASSPSVSLGHTEYGTSLDVVPKDGNWDGKFAQGLELLVKEGFEVGYDGSIPGTQTWSGHGRGNHAHIEFVLQSDYAGQSVATKPDARKNLRKVLLSGKLPPVPDVTSISGNTSTGALTPVTYSSGGTTLASTATPASGAASRKGQRPTGAEILAKLKKYGVGTTAPTTSTSSATLAELEKRYGAPTV